MSSRFLLQLGLLSVFFVVVPAGAEVDPPKPTVDADIDILEFGAGLTETQVHPYLKVRDNINGEFYYYCQMRAAVEYDTEPAVKPHQDMHVYEARWHAGTYNASYYVITPENVQTEEVVPATGEVRDSNRLTWTIDRIDGYYVGYLENGNDHWETKCIASERKPNDYIWAMNRKTTDAGFQGCDQSTELDCTVWDRTNEVRTEPLPPRPSMTTISMATSSDGAGDTSTAPSADAPKDTPGPALVLGSIGVAAAAWLTRRRMN